MTVAATQGTRTVPGSDFLQETDLALDNSYPTGGYLLSPLTFNLKVLRRIIAVRPRNLASAIYTPVLLVTAANGVISAVNLALLVATTGAQVANATDVSAASFHFLVEGN